MKPKYVCISDKIQKFTEPVIILTLFIIIIWLELYLKHHIHSTWTIKTKAETSLKISNQFLISSKVWSVLTRTKVKIYSQILLVYFWLICFPFSIYIYIYLPIKYLFVSYLDMHCW